MARYELFRVSGLHTYMHTHTRIYIHTYMHTRFTFCISMARYELFRVSDLHTHIYYNNFACTQLAHKHTHTYTYTHTQACIYIHSLSIIANLVFYISQTYMKAYIHTYIHVYRLGTCSLCLSYLTQKQSKSDKTPPFVSSILSRYSHTYIKSIHRYIHAHISRYVCILVSIEVRVYIHIVFSCTLVYV
jgi:hypothetical protein